MHPFSLAQNLAVAHPFFLLLMVGAFNPRENVEDHRPKQDGTFEIQAINCLVQQLFKQSASLLLEIDQHAHLNSLT